jgi:hypothetical protein
MYVLLGTVAICLLAALLLLPRVPMPRPPDTREQLRALINDRGTPGAAAARPDPSPRVIVTAPATSAASAPPQASPPAAAATPAAPAAASAQSAAVAAGSSSPAAHASNAAPAAAPGVPRIDLSAAARICSDLARVLDPADLQTLLERTAHLLDAKGLIVWVADRAGAALFPTLTTGYSQAVVARMGTIGRDDDNAAADAFRHGDVRIVDADDATTGALVIPINTAEGCVGVLAAEMRPGADVTPDTTAVARIIAAQLATFVTTVPAAANEQ